MQDCEVLFYCNFYCTDKESRYRGQDPDLHLYLGTSLLFPWEINGGWAAKYFFMALGLSYPPKEVCGTAEY